MNVVSLFTGVGGFDLGLERAGHRIVAQCEADEWRRAVLRHHWPDVELHDDVRTYTGGDADLICGGFPCQDVSVAGRRAGLAGERSGLWWEYHRIVDAVRPRWVLIENVPGLLTSNGGRDFGAILGSLADIGYVGAWRVLDSQFFGVPQRRRRVFLLARRVDGDPGTARDGAGEVLAVGSRCSRDHQAGREAGQEVAVASVSGLGNGGPDDNDGQAGQVVVAGAVTSTVGQLDDQGTTRLVVDTNIIAFHATQDPISGDVVPSMGHEPNGVTDGTTVRRLTPRECERLQGFPDDWTVVPTVNCPDSRRYSAMGDAVTVNVAHWIGQRLAIEEAL